MNVIVHYPKKEQKVKELQKKVAEIHADAVVEAIKRKITNKEDAAILVKMICDKYQTSNNGLMNVTADK